jgi:hypothetical protein
MIARRGESYLTKTLEQYTTPANKIVEALPQIKTLVTDWSNGYCQAIRTAGGIAHQTAVKCASDVDLFISLSPDVHDRPEKIYFSLYGYLQRKGYAVKKQNVALRLNYNDIMLDLIPGKQEKPGAADHTLFMSKKGAPVKTNVDLHTQTVKGSNSTVTNVIRLTKIWRERHALEFPSLYLELAVIRGLEGKNLHSLEDSFKAALAWITQSIENTEIVDPANSTNILSNEVTAAEKKALALKAKEAAKIESWQKVVW